MTATAITLSVTQTGTSPDPCTICGGRHTVIIVQVHGITGWGVMDYGTIDVCAACHDASEGYRAGITGVINRRILSSNGRRE